MALTISAFKNLPKRAMKTKVLDVTFDTSYATGGLALTKANLGLSTVEWLEASQSGGYTFEYDYANEKLKAFYGDNNNAADGPLIEVPAATNLSAVTTRVKAIGI